ncbi:hypothetical protein DOTSEDRAFT_23693 [Dothistroma septosporum NZE10]|uniref:BTB domain-containing protein n=1 Tax=Dothistroma septosporum (strain NZE10 / CBS 128990) TaxID=675120 RepID=N1PQN9_DOTSN|nr:hypothetical protein DOTSEDRAFT_23693 [Dothistroma septosporum NZE10]
MSANTVNLAGNAGEVLKKNVKDLLVSGSCSNLTIECRGKSFKVHKAILYTQSDFFKKHIGRPLTNKRSRALIQGNLDLTFKLLGQLSLGSMPPADYVGVDS